MSFRGLWMGEQKIMEITIWEWGGLYLFSLIAVSLLI
jgi:hypothetical protein